MFSVFRMAHGMGPEASGRGLCDIERLLLEVAKSCVRKLERTCTTKIYRHI